MNFFRKSSMILAGTAAAGLLAFACAGNDDQAGGLSSDLTDKPDHVLISEAFAGGGASSAAKGDFIELFNPTAKGVDLSKYSLHLSDADGDLIADYEIPLTGTLESGHYYLVRLTPDADLGVEPDLTAPLRAGKAVGLDTKLGSVELDEASTLEDGGASSTAISTLGYGARQDGKPVIAETAPAPALSKKVSAARLGAGCVATGDNSKDFELVAPTPSSTKSDGTDCSKVTVDAGSDSGTADSGSSDAGNTDAGRTDAGKKDASTASDDDSDDDDTDETPAPTPGKKKPTNVSNAAPQPLASSSSSCAAAPGTAPTSGLAGLAGLGLALAALGRRKKN